MYKESLTIKMVLHNILHHERKAHKSRMGADGEPGRGARAQSFAVPLRGGARPLSQNQRMRHALPFLENRSVAQNGPRFGRVPRQGRHPCERR